MPEPNPRNRDVALTPTIVQRQRRRVRTLRYADEIPLRGHGAGEYGERCRWSGQRREEDLDAAADGVQSGGWEELWWSGRGRDGDECVFELA